MADRVLVVEDLKVFYNEFQALFGVSLEVAAGETVAILGANGAGKTTLLNTIAGVLAPRRGKVVYRGDPVSGSPAYRLCRRGISMVPEGRRIFPSLTVEENLEVGAYSGRRGPWQREAIYNLFPILRERARVPGTELSGGEQQMLAIGRALMSNPDLILMDEISLGLAPLVVQELYKVVRAVAEAGTTVILVEQDVTRGLKAADRVYCLLEGRVSLEGRPAELGADQISRAYFGV
ncbi:MAG: ABC transporter ATP-binding protein [Chloroflexi bacterium RBG_16_63_12]|jgi:branched-chain amino acid transport system ATP-binding protein|nr:MAG: ABC transporter ATP-binding protein [Chloroflexi bacterium RBG_16_63_12]